MSIPDTIVMQGNLAVWPYDLKVWSVTGQPDNTGSQSGFAGQLDLTSIRANSIVYNNSTQNPLTLTVGGDLSGSLPNPSVSGLQGKALPTSAPNDGNLIQYNAGSSSWTYANLGSGLSFSGGAWTISNNLNFTGNFSLTASGTINLTGSSIFNSSVTFDTSTSFVGSPTFNSTVLMNTAEILWTNVGVAPMLTQQTQTSDVAANGIILQPQAPYASATGSHRNGSFVIVNTPAPVSGGTRGGMAFWDGGIIGSPYFTIQSDGSGNALFSSSGSIQMSSGSSITLNALVTATNNLTLDANLLFDKGANSPTITQLAPTSDVAPQNLKIQSQAPYSLASSNKNPGNIILNVPAPVAGGSRGLFQVTDNNNNVFEAQNDNSGNATILMAGNAILTAGSSIRLQPSALGFFNASPVAKQTITGALSSVTDTNAKNVLTSIINALVNYGLATNGTT